VPYPDGAGGPGFRAPARRRRVRFPRALGVNYSANITPAGIGERTDAELKRIITTGTRPDGSPMLPPMPYPYYANIKEDDLEAIIVYLRTLSPK
jgi:hypothetical protein